MKYSRLTQEHESYDGYVKIRAKDLNHSKINSADLPLVESTAKKLKKIFSTHFLTSLLFVLTILSLIFYDIKTNDIDLFVILLSIPFLGLSIYLFLELLSTRNYLSKRCQYGIVKSKFIRKTRNDNRIRKHYYINVIFPGTSTYIKNVICSEETFTILKKDGPVLVITFDNINAHAVNTNN